MDLVAFAAALKASVAYASDEHEAFSLLGRRHVSGLEHRLKQRDAELAAARAQLGRLTAETARMREWLDLVGEPDRPNIAALKGSK